MSECIVVPSFWFRLVFGFLQDKIIVDIGVSGFKVAVRLQRIGGFNVAKI